MLKELKGGSKGAYKAEVEAWPSFEQHCAPSVEEWSISEAFWVVRVSLDQALQKLQDSVAASRGPQDLLRSPWPLLLAEVAAWGAVSPKTSGSLWVTP